jgi:hypothetical protein
MTAPAPITADNVLELLAPSPRTSGSILWGPIGCVLPTTSYAALDGTAVTGLKDLGFADDNGLKQRETRSTTDVFVWGGDLAGTLQTQYDRTMTFRLMQFRNTEVLSATYGISNVSVVPATATNGKEIAVKLNAGILDTRSWVFDGVYANNLVRIVIPIGRVVTVGEIDMTHKTYMTVECTLKAYPDSNKNHGYLYVNDGKPTA